MEINQVLVSASPGDAVTNAAFELRSVLRRIGPSEIFAPYFHESLIHEVMPLDRYARRPGAHPETDLLLFHASIGEPDMLAFLEQRPERLVVIYHNISPAALFRDYDPRLAGLLESGRDELRRLATRTQLALADSAYNASELVDMGYRDVRISPLVVDVERLHAIEPHPPTAQHLATDIHGPVALYVGQLLPHKRPDLLIQAFHVLVTYLVPDARLMLVGSGVIPVYRQALQELINELNLVGAGLVGRVTDAELASYYRRADVFVTASEHEGFCVPVLEAMSFGTPVVARAHAAIPETLGGAGLLLPPDDDPVLMAEAMAMAMTEGAVRQQLAQRNRQRVDALSPDRARATFLRHLMDVV